ncbi:hypothetical protein DBB34_06550 [Sphaerisporangium cinnabarinum]|nr:hypothetical protein [Sphaerisporangium cinnabarinum]PTU56967.1 hypothetical protein DBB34_06550 [Sphaerisporangium cinnabarinum]
MDTNQAIEKIVAAGGADELRTTLDKHATSATREYEDIRSQEDYTEDARRRLLSEAYDRRKASLDNDLAQLASSAGEVDRSAVGRAFGTTGLPGDPASLTISLRDAQDRVAKIRDEDELETLLGRATRSGDEVLARAVAARAAEIGKTYGVEEFVRVRPDLKLDVDRAMLAVGRQSSAGKLEWRVRLGKIRPSELTRR